MKVLASFIRMMLTLDFMKVLGDPDFWFYESSGILYLRDLVEVLTTEVGSQRLYIHVSDVHVYMCVSKNKLHKLEDGLVDQMLWYSYWYLIHSVHFIKIIYSLHPIHPIHSIHHINPIHPIQLIHLIHPPILVLTAWTELAKGFLLPWDYHRPSHTPLSLQESESHYHSNCFACFCLCLLLDTVL